MKKIFEYISRYSQSLNSEYYHLPIDLFRIGVGALSFIYFFRTFLEIPYFLGNEGFINHRLVQSIFWYTWQPLFHPSTPDLVIKFIILLAMIFSVLMVIGYKSRLLALILFFICSSSYRYQFLVFFVDDVVMHLLLFWCFLLPTGKTLTLLEWLKDKSVTGKWLGFKTRGSLVNLLLINIGLIYFVAGISKYSSTLWLDGVALYAILKLPLGWFTHFNLEGYNTIIKIGNYLALSIEPLFVLIVLLKDWSKIKIYLGVMLFLFHLFIIATLDVPMANLGCIILAPIMFRNEIVQIIKKRKEQKINHVITVEKKRDRYIGYVMMFFLTGAMFATLFQDQWRQAQRDTKSKSYAEVSQSSAETGGKLQTFFYGGLWLMGLAQGYRLLDWIDERNFHQKIKIYEIKNNGKREKLDHLLAPIGMRGSLILTYISGVTWMHVDSEYTEVLNQDVRQNLANVYCKKINRNAKIQVWQSLTRIYSFQTQYNRFENILNFSCTNLKANLIRN